MQFVIDDQHFSALTRKAEPRCSRSDRQREVGYEPRLSGLWRSDDVHRLAAPKKTVYQDRLHLRILLHELTKRNKPWFGRILRNGCAWGLKAAEIDTLLRDRLTIPLV